MLKSEFFDQDAQILAQKLLGKVLRVNHKSLWLSAKIIETEAYYRHDKASHSYLGETPKRKALFMDPGTIYMYYARGSDSLNISCKGLGNAVLIKSGFPFQDQSDLHYKKMIACMQRLNPSPSSQIHTRPVNKICAGQTLLCRSLGLRVPDWDQKIFQFDQFFIEDVGYNPHTILVTTRLGIPKGRDEHLLYRFIDHAYAKQCSKNPLTTKKKQKIKKIHLTSI